MARMPCKVLSLSHSRSKLPPSCLCLCTCSAVSPPTLTSWTLQASWSAQFTPHSSQILGSVACMCDVWDPIQWVTWPGLSSRRKCQGLWKMQAGRGSHSVPQHFYQHFHWDALLDKWSGPDLPPVALLLPLLCPATLPGEKTQAVDAGGGPPRWVRSESGVGWKSPVWLPHASSGWAGHIASSSVLTHCEFLFHRFSHLLTKWSGRKTKYWRIRRNKVFSKHTKKLFNFTIQKENINLNHDKVFYATSLAKTSTLDNPGCW